MWTISSLGYVMVCISLEEMHGSMGNSQQSTDLQSDTHIEADEIL